MKIVPRILCLCLLHADAHAAQKPEIRDSDIRHNMPVRGALQPFAVSKKRAARFEKIFRRRFGMKPRFTAQTKNSKIYLLGKREARHKAFKNSRLRKVGGAPPYAFYDTTYRKRFKRGYSTLRDLLTGYKDARLNEKLLYGIADAYPGMVRLYEIGKTHLGREILAVQLGKFAQHSANKLRQKKIPVLFNCGIHGDELTSSEHCYRILYSILKNRRAYDDILQHIDLWVVPQVNPDGTHLFWHQSHALGRKNGRLLDGQAPTSSGRGVDLNRNFPFKWRSDEARASSDEVDKWNYRGDAPASEPETRALIDLFEEQRFVYSISFHSAASKLLIPYTINAVENPTPDYASELGVENAALTTAHHAKRKFVATKNLYPVDGTDQDFFYFKFGALAYILETSYHNCDYRYVQYYLDGYDEAWPAFLRDYANNYKFALQITDSAGDPIEARVEFEDLHWPNGEIHTSNPEDGTFFRLTKSGEPTHVTVAAEGFERFTVQMAPSPKGYPKPVRIILRRKSATKPSSQQSP